MKYASNLFKEILPNVDFDFQLLSRDTLDTKIKNEIIGLEVSLDKFPNDILTYKEVSSSPEYFNKYRPISDLPSSFKDISYSVKDYSKMKELQGLLLGYQSDIVKDIYIFDYFNNIKTEETKIGFRFIFQSKKTTLTAEEIDMVYTDIVNNSLSIKGVTIPGM
mgnify:FL=1